MVQIALLLALITLVFALKINSRQKRLVWEMERIQHRGVTNMNEIEQIRETFQTEIRKLKIAVRKMGDGPLFSKDTTFGEVLELHPRGREILARFHIGGCSSCAVSEMETIEQGTKAHHVDMDQLLSQLNSLTEEGEKAVPVPTASSTAQFVQFPGQPRVSAQ